MPNSNNATTEYELSDVVLDILSGLPTGEALYSQLFTEIRKRMTLTAEDKLPSGKRAGEEMWEQRVRNIKSHDDQSKNFIMRGLLESIPDGLKITPAGRAYLKSR